MGKLRYVESAFGYIPILEFKEYNLLVHYTDNLENITTNHNGIADSRGIVPVKDEKLGLLDEFGLKGLALEMVSI